MKLSIAMIVKNEEKNLSKTLDAIKVIEDKISYEIVIVDTGSEDNTINIAKKYTNRVYEHPWSGNFAEMRNISFKYCKGEWILVLDADEVLENPEELINFFLEGKDKFFCCATVNIKNIIFDRDQNYVIGSLFRLFKNISSFKFTGRIHEQPVLTKPLGNTKITFLHNGYSREDYELVRYKNERNKKLLLEDLAGAKGNEKIYILFQLAQTYSMANEDANTMKVIKEAYKLTSQRKDGKIDLYVLHFYAKELYTKQIYNRAIEIAEEAIKNNTSNLDFYYILALSYSNIRNYEKAQINFEKYFSIREKREDGVLEDITMVESTFDKKDEMLKERAICYYNANDYNKVVENFNLIEDESTRGILKEIYLLSSLLIGKTNSFNEYFENKELEDSDIANIISILQRLDMEEAKVSSDEIKEKLVNLDDRLEIYIKLVYFNEDISFDYRIIDFSTFYKWKSDLLVKLIVKDSNNLNLVYGLNKDKVMEYVQSISQDYDCLKVLYEYSVSNFLTVDIKKLNFLTGIERILLLSKSIEDDKYKDLTKRARINKLNLINRIYNKDVLRDKESYSILDKYDILWIESEILIKKSSTDKLAYVKGLRNMVKDFPEYQKLIKSYEKELNVNAISEEMEKEKENLFVVVEEYINSNKINEALEILDNLEELFMNDGKIYNYRGVATYLLKEYDKAILNLAISLELLDEKFDPAYNLACSLENVNRKIEAKYYYLKAYEYSNDENIKSEILNIIESLN